MTRLTVLDLFILDSIKRGICTAYDLQRRAGISPGASVPALKRMEGSGIVTRTSNATTRRRRFEFKVTPEGRRQFRHSWRESLSSTSPLDDIDSVLRMVDLAFHNGATRNAVCDVLERAIDSRRRLAKRFGTAVHGQRTLPHAYRELRERFDAKRCLFEAKALAELKNSILTARRNSPRRR